MSWISSQSIQIKSLIVGVTFGLSLATFLQWLTHTTNQRKKTNIPVSSSHIDCHHQQQHQQQHQQEYHHQHSTPSYSPFPVYIEHNSQHELLLSSSSNLPPHSGHPMTNSYNQSNGEINSESTPKEIAEMGISAIQQVINHLQDALQNLEKISQNSSDEEDNNENNVLDNEDEDEFKDANDPNERVNVVDEVRHLLEAAVLIHERCQQHLTSHVADYHPLLPPSLIGGTGDEESDIESFVSAAEYIDLSDLQGQILTCSRDDHLYRAALLELDEGNISYREVRTRVLQCANDTEYLAKLHCIRLAFDHLINNESKRMWFIETGRDSVVTLLQTMQFQASNEFDEALKNMCEYCQQSDSQMEIREELEKRGVIVLNVYDVIFDFILLEALDVLNNPPSTLLSVVNNRWLTDGFKKTALQSTVWTLLMAKRKLLKYPNGFMSHFYSIAGTVAPALGWGFLSNDPLANKACVLFKDCWMEFLFTLYGRQTRFTSVEDLAEDIQIAAKRCIHSKLIPSLKTL